MEECAHDEHHDECRPIGVLWVQVGASGTGPLSVLRAHGVCVRRWVSEPGHLYAELGLPLTNAAFGAARSSTATSPRIRAGDLGVRHHSPRGAGQQLNISILAVDTPRSGHAGADGLCIGPYSPQQASLQNPMLYASKHY